MRMQMSHYVNAGNNNQFSRPKAKPQSEAEVWVAKVGNVISSIEEEKKSFYFLLCWGVVVRVNLEATHKKKWETLFNFSAADNLFEFSMVLR